VPAPAADPGITAIILAFNEAIHLRRCIERVRPIASRIVVVDSYSTDATPEIAVEMGAELLQRRFTHHADQFRWGVQQAGIDGGWILRIDSDEYLQPGLIQEIRERLPTLPDSVGAVEMKLRVHFQGKWIRWGGYYQTVLTRLWRVGAAEIEQRLMDERVVVRSGEIVRFSGGDLIDENLKDMAFWTDKHNSYSTKHMVQYIDLEFGLLPRPGEEDASLGRQGKRKRFLRDNVYARSPLYLRSILYYLYRYVMKLGFLDGKQGFVWHTLQGFWHFLLIDVKVGEARRFIRAHGVPAFREHIATRYGIRIEDATDKAGRLP
jgi:glycosyltransferase involved in cell wall biosynthesis